MCVAFAQDTTRTATLLAFGDVNLGRSVGQELLKGNLSYPFDSLGAAFAFADIVFANLESQLTDQKGETQHPQYNLIFCGPPQGAQSLKQAGFNIVSTANNHAFDYKLRALKETIRNLGEAGISFVGTNAHGNSRFAPVFIEKNGIRFGFAAYTLFVNSKKGWRGYISDFDTARIRRELRILRDSSDVVVASYHGGKEYVDRPDVETDRHLKFLADAGADVVLGHHPHVPQGIERYNGSWIFKSLGNFVFYQPQLEWTQKSFGVRLKVEKNNSRVRINAVSVLPLRASRQPSFSLTPLEVEQVRVRLQKLSNVELRSGSNAAVNNSELEIQIH